VYREDILDHAYRMAKANRGAPGVDGVSFADIEGKGLENWLTELQEVLRNGEYRAEAVRRVYIPKPGGAGERPLGIPTIRDRVAQGAAMLVLGPIFEAEFEDSMYGYRPERSARQAIGEVHKAVRQGYTDVVDADLSRYFDEIPHADLLRSVARRGSDGAMLKLLRLWLKAPVSERDDSGNERRSGGSGQTKGTPQGGVASPLLANIYMNRFLRCWKDRGMEGRLKAKVVNYADDFVILCQGTAHEALEVTRRWIGSMRLTLNEKKTRLCDARRECFDFLGYTFGPVVHRPTGRRYLAARPSKKAVARLRQKVREVLTPGNTAPWPEVVTRVNRQLAGWGNYFSYGTVSRAYWMANAFTLERARGFLMRRHKMAGRGTRRFPADDVFGRLGLLHLGGWKVTPASNALT
jgi:RNA-directed DNA polymerase